MGLALPQRQGQSLESQCRARPRHVQGILGHAQRREFEKMDTEGSGEISLAALKQVLVSNAGAGSLGALTEEEVEDIFNAMRVRKTETKFIGTNSLPLASRSVK